MEDNLNKISLQAQKYIENMPVIVLGSGASVSYGLPSMWRLSEYLKENIKVENDENWGRFIKLLDEEVDLESALHAVSLDAGTTQLIVKKTWELISSKDTEVFFKSLHQKDYFSLSTLLNKLFRSTSTELNIITTNYDRLAEYACEKSELYHFTGFTAGFYRTKVSEDQLRASRKVNIWKVHGSLDWFKNGEQSLIGLPNITSLPDGLLPEIVTPGIEKYKKTHIEPYRTIIQAADYALERNNNYICIGYGFNDEHIQEKLINKCVHGNSKLLIITKELTDATKKFLFEQGCKNYLAFECNEDVNTKVYSSEFGEIIMKDSNYWSLDGFLELI